MKNKSDFYEDDEPVDKVVHAFDSGKKGYTTMKTKTNEEIYRLGFLASKELWDHTCERCLLWASGLNGVQRCDDVKHWFEDVAAALKLESEREDNS